MKRIMFTLFIAFIGILACKQEKQISNPQDVNGKYVKEIDHYKIKFEDGSTFDLNEKSAHKIYYLARHAEKDSIPKGNPNLSEKGVKRANHLASIFKNTQIDALYSTLTTRTLFTVDTLADVKGLVTFPYDAKDFRKIASDLEQSLEYHKVFIVGHSNTIPVLANHLYGEEYYNQVFDEADYDNLVVIIEDLNKNKKLLSLKYK